MNITNWFQKVSCQSVIRYTDPSPVHGYFAVLLYRFQTYTTWSFGMKYFWNLILIGMLHAVRDYALLQYVWNKMMWKALL